MLSYCCFCNSSRNIHWYLNFIDISIDIIFMKLGVRYFLSIYYFCYLDLDFDIFDKRREKVAMGFGSCGKCKSKLGLSHIRNDVDEREMDVRISVLVGMASFRETWYLE